MKLTEREIELLKAGAKYSISDQGNGYYLLGGHGLVPIRYDYRTLPKLQRQGFVTREVGYWRTTEAGKMALEVAAREAAVPPLRVGFLDW